MINLFKKYHQLFLSTIFFALFSFSVTLFAAPFAPGATLDPGCVPGSSSDCTVAPVAMGSSITSATAGSLLFAGTAGIMAQDNSNLFWDDTNNRLGVGTTAPTSKFHVLAPAASSVGETMASFGVSDDTTSLFYIGNGTSIDSSFMPMLKGVNSGTTIALAFIGQGTTDTGTTPIMTFQSRIGSGGVSATRPLFSWRNFVTPVMTMSADGKLGIGTTTPAYLLSVGANTDTSVYAGTGTGADMHITGTYTGNANVTYTITVDGGNPVFSPNTIEIKKNGVVVSVYQNWAMDNLPTATPLYLGDGLYVGFDEGADYYSDHDTGDVWTITATATGNVSVAGTYRTGANFFGSQEVDDTNLYLGKGTPFGTSSGTANTFVGISAGAANTTAYMNTLVGNGAGINVLDGYQNTFIGASAGSTITSGTSNTFLGINSGINITSGTDNLFLGRNATGASATSNAVALGSGATVTANNSIAIGLNATTATLNSIIIGAYSTATLPNQMVIGSSSNAIDNVFIGNGVTAATAGSVVINASGGSGSNKTGGNITLAGGIGTGTTGVGGVIIFSTSDFGTGLATTAQTLTEKMRVAVNGDITIASRDKGTTGATMSGPIFTIGRNSNATPAMGSINLLDSAGTARYYWADTAGKLCYLASAPLNASVCAPVGDQTSTRNTKQDITDFNDTSGALSMIVNAPLHKYRYINEVEGYGTDSPLAKYRLGFIADEVDPQFMWGSTIDQVSINGLLMASVQELNIKLQNISGLTSSSGNGSVVNQLVGAIVNLKELIVEKITTKELCLEDVCITKTELQQLLQQNNISAPVSSVPIQSSVTVSEPVAEVPATVVDTTQDEVVAPVPTDTIVEQIPDPVIIIEPTPDSAPTPVSEVVPEPAPDALLEPVL